MSLEERVGKVERKVKTVEEAVRLLTQLVVSHGEGLEKSLRNGDELNAKISALIDAQIRSEDKISALSESQTRNDVKMAALIEAQNRTDNSIFALSQAQNRTDVQMAALVESQAGGDEKLQNINAALDKLTRLADKAHSRIDRLEN